MSAWHRWSSQTMTDGVSRRNPPQCRKPAAFGKAKQCGRSVSQRIEKSWLVFVSLENFEHDRCVDLFARPDGSYGFEEFRRDVEDRGIWTPVSFYSGAIYPSREAALAAALQSVAWLPEAIRQNPSAQKLLPQNPNRTNCATQS
jgi:hypothetical protein